MILSAHGEAGELGFELDALGSSPLGGLFALTLGKEGALLLEAGEEVAFLGILRPARARPG